VIKIIFIRGIPSSGKTTLSLKLSSYFKLEIINPDNIAFNSEFIKFKNLFRNGRIKNIKYKYCLKKAEKLLSEDRNFIWEQPWRNTKGIIKTINYFKKINKDITLYLIDLLITDDIVWERIKKDKYKNILFKNRKEFDKFVKKHQNLNEIEKKQFNYIPIYSTYDIDKEIQNLPF
jgi:tRNA uridine 5-carbamoylmethylation protein Kti12